MRFYLNQSDIDKAVKERKNSHKYISIADYCPIAQLIKRKYHGKIEVGNTYIFINRKKVFELRFNSKANKITRIDQSDWYTIKPQHINMKGL